MFIPRPEIVGLQKALDDLLSQGIGTTIFVSGEPGLGKSTLVEQFLNKCDDHQQVNILTATGRCIDLDGISRGYLPWQEVLIELDADCAAGNDREKKNSFKTLVKTLFDESGADWIQNIPEIGDISSAILETAQAIQHTEQIDTRTGEVHELGFRQRLQHVVKECAGSWLGVLPVVGGLAAAVYSTSMKLAEKRRDMVMRSQEDFFMLVMRRLRELAKQNPIIVFLDDLQWADASSLSLLLYLAKNLHDKTYPLLLIGTYRPEDVQRGRLNAQTGEIDQHPFSEKLNILMRYDAFRQIALGRLDEGQILHYLNERFQPNNFGERFMREILRVTNGNTLFVQEMLTTMTERGIVKLVSGIWEAAGTTDYLTLPRTVEGVIKERYERLGEEFQELLQLAAVQGEDFSLDVIAAILEENPIKLHRKIDNLINKYHLVHKSTKVYEKLTKIYEFTHNLVQKYIYYSMEWDFRRDVHRMIAGTLKGMLDEGVRSLAAPYAFHLGVGHGIIDEAGRVIAGQNEGVDVDSRNAVLGEYIELRKELAQGYIAAHHNEEAINACSEIIELARLNGDLEIAIDYLMKKGDVLLLIGKWDAAKESYREALARSEELGDRSGLATLAGKLGAVYFYRGEYDRALECFQQKMSISEELGNRNDLASAIASMGLVHSSRGEFDCALECFQRRLSISEELDDRSGIARSMGYMGGVYSSRGEYDRALECFQRQLSINEELGIQRDVAVAIGNIGNVYCACGKYDRAFESYQQALSIYKELGDPVGTATMIGAMGLMYSDRGEYDRALESLHQAMKEHRALGLRYELIYWLQGIAPVLLELSVTTQGSPSMPVYLPTYVPGVTLETWRVMSLQRARRDVEESLAISEELQKLDTLINGRVLLARIDAAEGHHDVALQRLNAMLNTATDDEQRAELHYWLWKIGYRTQDSGHREEHCGQALGLYIQMFEKTPKHEYHKRIEELRASLTTDEGNLHV